MILNDILMLIFWVLFFDRFPQVAGWGLHDVLLLWAISAGAFGISTVFFGNAVRLALLIVQGQMDYYLSLPRNTLLHTLISRMSLSGWGDIAFGTLAFIVSGPSSASAVALYILLVACAAAIFTAFEVIAGTLAFYLGNGEAVQLQAQNAVMLFATYPGSIFRGWTRVLVFTAIPAGFISHIPVELLRNFDVVGLLAVLGFSVAIWLVAVVLFRVGLRRYESGNLVGLRG
jgi:ABC-2 type transport system permease protein